MAKKKNPWYQNIKNWMWIFGIPACVSALIFSAKVLVSWADVPERVKKVEDYVAEQRTSNQIQQRANELMQQMIVQKDDVIYSPDGKYYFDKQTQKWIPVKGGK